MADTTLKSGIVNSALVGISNFHVAKVLDDPTSGATTYDTVISVPQLRQVQIKPKNNSASLYGDNVAVETANATSEYELTIETAQLPTEYRALLMGHTFDSATGTMKVSGDDVAPYFAVMFEAQKNNGKKRFVRFTKVKFAEPDETYKTKEESISFTTPSITGTAIYRNSDKLALVQADEEATGYQATTGEKWYTLNEQKTFD